MTDDDAMRARLQQVATYRQVCRAVRRTGRHNILWAGVMLFLWYLTFQGPAKAVGPFSYVYLGLAVAELLVGLYKLVAPSAEGLLLDGIVLVLFAGASLGRQALLIAAGARPSGWILFGLFLLFQSVGQFRAYGQLRRAFPVRPTRDQLAWFDDLARETREADPRSNELAVDLPTKPHWKGQLLGGTAFLVTARGEDVWVAGPGSLEVVRHPEDAGTGRRPAGLRVYGVEYPEFAIDDASWDNYRRWAGANPAPAA